MVKSSIVLWSLLHVSFANFCFGQDEVFSLNEQGKPINQKDATLKEKSKVKVVRTYTSEQGVLKMGPFHLTQEIHLDESARVRKDVSYAYNESVFGNDTSVTVQEFSYDNGGNKVKFLKKTYVNVVNKERFTNGVGYEYDEDGTVSKTVLYEPDGTVKELNDVGNSKGVLSKGTPMSSSSPSHLSITKPKSNGRDGKNYNEFNSFRTHVSNASKSSRKRPSVEALQKEAELDVVETYEPNATGYTIKKVAGSGEILAEQRVLLNDNKQVKQVVNVSNNKYNSNNQDVSITNYLYDAAGKEIQQTVLDNKGKLLIKYEYAYDENGRLKQAVWSDKKGKVLKAFKYEYELY